MSELERLEKMVSDALGDYPGSENYLSCWWFSCGKYEYGETGSDKKRVEMLYNIMTDMVGSGHSKVIDIKTQIKAREKAAEECAKWLTENKYE
jgi:hypothetical protein